MKKAVINIFKWMALSVLTGIIVGIIGFCFDKALELATEFRQEHSWTLFLLPVAGLAIAGLYQLCGYKKPEGTDRIFRSAKMGNAVSINVAPLIFVSTALTHLTGGSAGREGAALQLGGSIANSIGRLFKMDKESIQEITVCGMASGFAALFGTPLVSAVFALEVLSNKINYALLFPSLVSAVTAAEVSKALGTVPFGFVVSDLPEASLQTYLFLLLFAVVIAGLSVLFCFVMEEGGELYRKYIKNPYIRALVGSALIIGLTLLLNTRDYNGAGTDVIKRAFEGDVVPYAFLLKLLFTAITLGAGFKGGEIVPTFFVGATFGALVGPYLGFSPSFAAGVAMVGLFAGVTNCPLASIFMAYEFFGGQGLIYWAVMCVVSYMLSSKFSLYSAQELPDKIFYHSETEA